MSRTAILADDHLLFRQGLRYMLESESDVTIIGEAGTGVEAVEMVKIHNPDLVVLDIEMPGLDGVEAAKRIRESCPEVQILVLSMHSEKGFISEMFAAGASGFILKDSALEEVVKAIDVVLSGQKYMSNNLLDVVIEDLAGSTSREKTRTMDKLSGRERDVLVQLAEGKTTKEIAFDLELSVKTVDTYRRQLMSKLGIDNIADLIKFAIRQGLVDL